MDILIRNVDAGSVAKIDELATKKNMSRNAYLKTYIETLSVLNELKDQENKYSNLVNTMLEVIQQNTSELKLIKSLLEIK